MSFSDRDRAAGILAAAPWLTDHDPRLTEALLAHGRIVRLTAGAWAQAEGDDDTGLMVVIEGVVQILCQAPGDRQMVVGNAGAGVTLGQTLRFGGGPRLVTVTCVEPCTLMKISDLALARIAAQQPEIWRAVAALLYLQLRGALAIAMESVALPPRARLAHRLLLTARAFDQGEIVKTLRLGQQALGDMLGLTRKTVNLYLGEFQQAGLVRLGYGTVEILDPAGLRRIAEA
jgi:CRP/FNR family transcriptional regulator, cyclic AMP receptor protein